MLYEECGIYSIDPIQINDIYDWKILLQKKTMNLSVHLNIYYYPNIDIRNGQIACVIIRETTKKEI